jgi:hypothetical protein
MGPHLGHACWNSEARRFGTVGRHACRTPSWVLLDVLVAWRSAFAQRVDSRGPRGRSSEAEHQLPKLRTRVRFPSPALL